MALNYCFFSKWKFPLGTMQPLKLWELRKIWCFSTVKKRRSSRNYRSYSKIKIKRTFDICLRSKSTFSLFTYAPKIFIKQWVIGFFLKCGKSVIVEWKASQIFHHKTRYYKKTDEENIVTPKLCGPNFNQCSILEFFTTYNITFFWTRWTVTKWKCLLVVAFILVF